MLKYFKHFFGKTPKPEPPEMIGLIKISGCDNPKRCGDVIFVHGLGGHARGTWHPQELRNDDNFWLTWLAKERPDLGIWSFGYKAEPFEWRESTMPLFDRASNLQKYLEVYDIGKYPIIFITHSMGGLLVKEMLRNAQTFKKEAVIQQTKGIVFLSTPHTGSHLANLVDKIGILARSSVSVNELKVHIPQLRQLNEWYRQNVDSMDITTEVYYETKPIQGFLVVDQDSANPGIKDVRPTATDNDHISITKPKSIENLVYKGVSHFIKQQLLINPTIVEQPIISASKAIEAVNLSNRQIIKTELLNPDKVKFDAEYLRNSPDKLEDVINTLFNSDSEELEALLVSLYMSYQELHGETQQEKVRTLVTQLEGEDDIKNLIEGIKDFHPEAFI